MSSREDRGRYRGRRRAPTPPRTRYAAVVTTAFLGAGVVALGTAAAFSGNATTDPVNLAAAGSVTSTDLADRQATLDRATRGDNRTDAGPGVDQLAADFWVLPLKNYSVSAPFGPRWETSTLGVDLATSEGTPYVAAHAGTVVLARPMGGYGYTVEIDTGNGTTLVYGHSSALLVREGQKVEAGQVLGFTGNTGYSTTPHLRFEVRQRGQAIDPVSFLFTKGVDINSKTQSVDG